MRFKKAQYLSTILGAAILLFMIYPAFAISTKDGSLVLSSNAPQQSGTDPQPDLLIKSYSELDTAYQTDNVYQQVPSDQQIKTIDSIKGNPVTFQVKLQNDSAIPQSYCLKAKESADTGWAVNYSLDDRSRIINTYAGGGTDTTDGIDATSYNLGNFSPISVAYDHKGDLYIGGYSKIWRVDSNNKIYLVAGNGVNRDGSPAISAEVVYVSGMAFDANDNLYFTELTYHRVRRIDARTGVITTIAGNSLTHGFSGDGGPAINATLNHPIGITVDTSGNILFCDMGNNRIRRIDSATQKIDTIAGTGIASYNGDSIPASEANINGPFDVIQDTAGNLYVTELLGGRIRKIDASTGLIQTIAGAGSSGHSGDGDLATQASINPEDICLDKDFNIFFSEPTYIRKIDAKTGIITTICGNSSNVYMGDGKPASFSGISAKGLTIRDDGALLIADSGNQRVRIIEKADPIQDAIVSTGYITPAITVQNYIVINATITRDLQTFPGSQKSVIFEASTSSTDTAVGDSVKAIVNLSPYDQPDLMIKKQADPDTLYAGDRIYQESPADSQILNQNLKLGESAYFNVKLQNKGDQPKSFLLKSIENQIPEWTCTYCINGVSITSHLLDSGYTTPVLNPGDSIVLDIAETPSLTVEAGVPKTTVINVYNDNSDTTVEDSVKASAIVYRPDLLIKGASELDNAYQTENVYQQTPSDLQIKTIDSIKGNPVSFQIKLQNNSDTSQTYYLKAEESADTRWTVDYSLDPNSRLINLYAGNGFDTADGTAAKSYDLVKPYSLVYDHNGNLFVGGYGYIWKIDMNDKVTRISGNGSSGFSGDGDTAANAVISSYVSGLAFDIGDNLYFVDSLNKCIRRIDAQTGIITTVAGNGNQGFSGDGGPAVDAEMSFPQAIAVDSTGNVFFSDRGDNRIRRIDASTQVITTFAGTGNFEYNGEGIAASNANLNDPFGIAFDSSDNLYIVEDLGARIRKIDAATGCIQTLAGTGTIKHDGNGGLASQADLYYPENICLDKDSNIYFTENGLYVRKIDTKTGIISAVAGDDTYGSLGDGGTAVLAEFNKARGIAMRDDGFLMVADYFNDRIRMIGFATEIQNNLISEGYATQTVPAKSSIVIDATMTPDSLTLGASQKSVIFKAYPSDTDTLVGDSVQAIAQLPVFAQPDLMIKKQADPDTSYIGDNTYQETPADNQAINQELQLGETARFSVKLQNKGDQAQSFLLKSVDNKLSGWTCTYSVNGSDVTADFVGSGYTTPVLNPKDSIILDITEISNQEAAVLVPETLTVSVYNDANDTIAGDSVKASAEVGRPDLQIKSVSEPEISYEIDNVYQQVPSGQQIKTINSATTDPIGFQIKLQNDSNAPRSYYLKTEESPDTGWTVNYSLEDNARRITTYAGGGESIEDGTDATAYQFDWPSPLTYDHQGNLYVGGYCYIWKIDTDSKVTVIAGNGIDDYSGDGDSAVNASISVVSGLAFDANENLYFTDTYNQCVRRIDAQTEIITTVAGNRTQSFSGDGGLATAATLNQPAGIVIDSTGNLLISDWGNNRIRKIDASTQIISTYAGTGTTTYNGDGIAASQANLFGPVDIKLDSEDNLYIVEYNGARLRKVDAATKLIQTIAGNGSLAHSGDGGPAIQASLDFPDSICFDKESNIYLAEANYVRMVDAKTGIITTIAGNGNSGFSGDEGPAIQASLGSSIGIVTRNDGSVMIADSENNRIRMIEAPNAIQDNLTSGGYATLIIPANGSIVVDAQITPDLSLKAGSTKSVIFNTYYNSTDTNVMDSVESVAQIIAAKPYAPLAGFIKEGWNLVSLPTDPVNPDPLTVFAGIDIANSSFQYWDNTADPCMFQGYGSALGWTGPVVRGTPYWFVRTVGSSDTSISYEGIEPSTDFEMTIPAHTSAPYWIMVGTPFPSAVSADAILFKDISKRGDNWLTWSDAYSNTNSALRVVDSSMQGWDASQNTFVRLTPSEFAATGDKTQFDPWWGYWLLVTDKNELQIKFPKPAQ